MLYMGRLVRSKYESWAKLKNWPGSYLLLFVRFAIFSSLKFFVCAKF
jgi:hypothetical protein